MVSIIPLNSSDFFIKAARLGKRSATRKLVSVRERRQSRTSANTKKTPYRHLEIVKYLVEKGSNIYILNDLILKLSVYRGDSELVKYLVEARKLWEGMKFD